MRFLSSLVLLGSLSVSSGAHPPNKKFNEVAREESNGSRFSPPKVALKMVKKRGLEGSAPSTAKARKRITKSNIEEPAFSEDEPLQSIAEYQSDDDVAEPTFAEEPVGSDADGSVKSPPSEHGSPIITKDSQDGVPAIFQLVNSEPTVRVEDAHFDMSEEKKGKIGPKVRFTNAHQEVLLALIGNKRGRTSTDDKDLFEKASQLFEGRGLRKVSRRNFMKHLKGTLRGIEDDQDLVLTPSEVVSLSPAVSSAEKIFDLLSSRGKDEIKHSQTSGEAAAIPKIHSIVGTHFITAAHGEVLRNLVSSSLCRNEDLFKLAREEFRRRNLYPLSYDSFLSFYSGRGSSSMFMKCKRSVDADAPVKENDVTIQFSDLHREIMMKFIHKSVYTADERNLLFKEVSKEFEERGLHKVSRETFNRHLSGLFSKEDYQPILADEAAFADAVGGLLLLREGV